MNQTIPDKLYFKIGEVAEIAGVKPHVLRYWESEFDAIRPTKSRSQQRLYRREDIELIIYLKDLLHNQGFTVAGARKKLRERKQENRPGQMGQPLETSRDSMIIAEIQADLQRLRNSLELTPSE